MVIGAMCLSMVILLVGSLVLAYKPETQDYILPYSGVPLHSKEGQELLQDFIKRNDLEGEDIKVIETLMCQAEEEAAAEMLEDMLDTQMSAKPNCFD